MGLAARANGAHVDERVAVLAAAFHALPDAGADGGHQVLGDHTAGHLALELEARALRQRLEPNGGDTELAVAAALLLVPALHLDAAGERFAVRHLHVGDVEGDAGACDARQRRRGPRAHSVVDDVESVGTELGDAVEHALQNFGWVTVPSLHLSDDLHRVAGSV